MGFKKILAIRLSSLGDIVRAVPALLNLKENCEELTFLVEDRFKPITKLYPYFDNLLFFPRNNLSITTFKNFFENLRSREYDVSLDLHGILKSAIITSLSKAKRKIGYSKNFSKEFSHLFYGELIGLHKDSRISRYSRYELALDYLGIEKKELRGVLPKIEEDDEEYAEKYLRENGLKESEFIFIFVGASRSQRYKRWPIFRFLKLVKMVEEKLGLRCLLSFGPDEVELLREVKDLSPILKPVGLSKSVAVMMKSLLYIGGDTGLTHIATLAQKKSVVIFGATDKVINEPYGKNWVMVYKDGIFKDCSKNCKHSSCMGKIDEYEVFEAVERVMKKNENN